MYETYAVNATDGNCKILRDGLSDTEYDMGLGFFIDRSSICKAGICGA
jgi:hypothetical protein